MPKLIQDFTLHTHTIGFDGRNTPAEMAARVRELGMTALGVSNHFIVHPDITKTKFYPAALARGYNAIYSSSFDEVIAKFQPHYAELEKLSDICGIKILRGMEVDYFDYAGWGSSFMRAVKVLKPDYVIGASHFIEYDGRLCNVHDIAYADAENRNNMIRMYWDKIGRAATTGLFNWMAHLDLPKKTVWDYDVRWANAESHAVDAIAKSKTPIEINTGLYRPERDEPYPSPRILRMAAAANVPVLISDDAHRAEQIGRHFSRAYDLAKSCGITQFLSLSDAVHSR